MRNKKDIVFENQGYEVYPVFKVLAEIALENEGKAKTKENVHHWMQKLADENKESYTPSYEVGKNPGPRMTKKLKKIISPIFLGNKSIIRRNMKSTVEIERAEKEIDSAVTQLSDAVVKYGFNMKYNRADVADKTDPNKLTDFEFIGMGPGNNYSKDELAIYNKAVVANRYIRRIVANYIYASLYPVVNLEKNDYYKILLHMGFDKLTTGKLESKTIMEQITYKVSTHLHHFFSRNIDLKSLLKFRI